MLMHDFYHFAGIDHSLLGYDFIKAAALVIDSEAGHTWSNRTVHHQLYPQIPQLSTLLPSSTSEATTQTFSFPANSPSAASESTLITRVLWDQNAVDIPMDISMDEEKLSAMAEDVALVADASFHAYKDSEPEIPMTQSPDLINIFEENVDELSEQSDESTFVKLCCVEEIKGKEETAPKISEDGLPEHPNALFLQTTENTELSTEAFSGLKQLLWDHKDTFVKSKTDIGFCNVVQPDIDMGDTRPIVSKKTASKLRNC